MPKPGRHRAGNDATGVPSLASVLGNAEFRGLWLAEGLIIGGDQLAKVALAIMVFDRTGSPLWSALVYAMTFLPALAGGLGLSQLADRFPRRTVMLSCALTQAGLVGLMTVPAMPLVALCALVFLVALAAAPTNASINATARETFTDDAQYLRSQDLRGVTLNTMMLIGLAAGGTLVTMLGARWALGINAMTFLIAAAILATQVRWRPSAGSQQDGWFDGARLVCRDPKLRVLMAMTLLVGITVVPEGLAAPLARELDAPDHAVGWLLGADPFGFIIGTFVLSKFVSAQRRLQLIGPLAIASSAVLLGFAIQPNLALALVLLALSGATGAYIITVIATVNTLVPNEVRGGVVGVGQTSLRVCQGLGVALGGAIAQGMSSATTTIALFSVVGVLAASGLAVAWAHVSSRETQPSLQPGSATT